MLKKLIIVSLSAVLLGGCTLLDSLKTGDAARDAKPQVVETSTPTPSIDPELQTIPSPASGTDTTSLETDINSTTILDENFSDLN